jgi:hypothetical protein
MLEIIQHHLKTLGYLCRIEEMEGELVIYSRWHYLIPLADEISLGVLNVQWWVRDHNGELFPCEPEWKTSSYPITDPKSITTLEYDLSRAISFRPIILCIVIFAIVAYGISKAYDSIRLRIKRWRYGK